MSIEQQRKTTHGSPEYQIPTVPDHAPDYAERTDDFSRERESHRRRNILLGVGTFASGLALAGGLFAGNKLFGSHDNDPTKAGQRPVATASATPGETVSAAPQESFAPNPEAGTWTEENVPIMLDTNGDGKVETYKGVTQAVEALKLKAEDYPTPEAYEKAFIERVNQWMNWGNSPAMDKQYAGYLSLDSNDVLGSEAIANDFVDHVFKAALTSDHEEGVPIQGNNAALNEGWANDMESLRQDIRTKYEFSVQEGRGGEPYTFAFTPDSMTFSQGATTAAPYGGTVKLTYNDNFEKTGIAKAQQTIGSPYSKKSGSTEWNPSVQVQDGSWYTVGVNYAPIQ